MNYYHTPLLKLSTTLTCCSGRISHLLLSTEGGLHGSLLLTKQRMNCWRQLRCCGLVSESRIRFQLNAEYATFAFATTNTSPLGRMKKKSIMNELDWSGIWFLESVYDSNASKLNVPWSTIIKSWHEVDISRTFRAVEAKIVMHTFMWRFGVISFKAWKSQARFERLLSKHYFKSHEFQELIEKWDEKGVRQLN